MKEMMTGNFVYNNEDYNFNFDTSLSALDKQLFVRTVVSNIVDESGYDVLIRDLIFDFAIIEFFTNIDTSFINMKDDDGNDVEPIIVIEHFLEETNVVDIVKANIEYNLLDELNHAIDLNIQYLTGIHINPLNEALASLISTIEKRIDTVDLEEIVNIAQKFAGMTDEFTIENAMDIFMNSDFHKKNLAEIDEVKGK